MPNILGSRSVPDAVEARNLRRRIRRAHKARQRAVWAAYNDGYFAAVQRAAYQVNPEEGPITRYVRLLNGLSPWR